MDLSLVDCTKLSPAELDVIRKELTILSMGGCMKVRIAERDAIIRALTRCNANSPLLSSNTRQLNDCNVLLDYSFCETDHDANYDYADSIEVCIGLFNEFTVPDSEHLYIIDESHLPSAASALLDRVPKLSTKALRVPADLFSHRRSRREFPTDTLKDICLDYLADNMNLINFTIIPCELTEKLCKLIPYRGEFIGVREVTYDALAVVVTLCDFGNELLWYKNYQNFASKDEIQILGMTRNFAYIESSFKIKRTYKNAMKIINARGRGYKKLLRNGKICWVNYKRMNNWHAVCRLYTGVSLVVPESEATTIVKESDLNWRALRILDQMGEFSTKTMRIPAMTP